MFFVISKISSSERPSRTYFKRAISINLNNFNNIIFISFQSKKNLYLKLPFWIEIILCININY